MVALELKAWIIEATEPSGSLGVGFSIRWAQSALPAIKGSPAWGPRVAGPTHSLSMGSVVVQAGLSFSVGMPPGKSHRIRTRRVESTHPLKISPRKTCGPERAMHS